MRRNYQVNRGCTFCATCIYECPVDAISMGSAGAVINQKLCIGCGDCSNNCASEAISEITEQKEEPTPDQQ